MLGSSAVQVAWVYSTGGTIFALGFLGMLTFQHWYQIVANITTNESMNKHKYEVFRGENGALRNPFDHGTWRNFVHFWTRPQTRREYQMDGSSM